LVWGGGKQQHKKLSSAFERGARTPADGCLARHAKPKDVSGVHSRRHVPMRHHKKPKIGFGIWLEDHQRL
jgi:hypothetical protein